ncbi:MAG: hypothetical protein AAFR81_21715 [Chloroflexota bacterium]
METSILSRRGIASTAKNAGWIPYPYRNFAGWAYPVHDPFTGEIIARRWKATDKNSRMKYGWLPSKPEHPYADWYILPASVDAISRADGVAYLANGEPSLLAYHSAGIQNAIATTLSEVGIPKNLIATLSKLGIHRLLYPVDNDTAGEKSAVKWRDALTESGIDFVPFSWGASAPEKADANDIWIACQFDSDAFAKTLNTLSPLALPAPETPKNTLLDDTDFDRTPQGLIDALANALGITGWKSNGWAQKNISSPFRQDAKPSATFNRDSGVLHDFGTGESYSPTQIAEQLGIDWRSYYPQRKTETTRPRIASPESVTRVTVPLFHADTEVNLRYISDLDLDLLGDTNSIRSPLATGKTSLIRRIIDNAPEDANILVVTHLQALAENIAQRLSHESQYGFECYQYIPHDYRRSVLRMVCSYDSLHTVRDDWDYVFIDEHEQFQRHLTSGTMRGGEPRRAYEKLLSIVRNAGQVTVLDAHMSMASNTWLTAMRGEVTSIMNTYRHDWGTLKIHTHESNLLQRAFLTASRDDGKGVVIPTNSRTKSRDYYTLACEQFGADAVLLINGENSSSKDAQQAIHQLTKSENAGKALCEIFPNLKILICSPSLATGIDVQATVSGVFGVFLQQPWVNACNIMQMMMRYRRADHRHMCIIGSSDIPTEKHNILNAWTEAVDYHRIRVAGTAWTANFKSYGIEAFDGIDTLITGFNALFESETKLHQKGLKFFVEMSAYDEGFSVEYTDGYAEDLHEGLKNARKQRQEQFKDALLSLAPISPDEFDALRQNPETTSEQLRDAYSALERWHIEYMSGHSISPELVQLLGTPRQRRDFNRLVDLLDDPNVLKSRDRDEAQTGVLVIQRKHFIRNRDLIVMAGQAVFGDKWLTSEETVTTEQIATRLESYLRVHMLEIQHYVDRRCDLSETPISIFRRLLKRVGLKLGRKQRMDDGKRFYEYFIDAEHRNLILTYAKDALDVRNVRDLLQTRTTLINIREWRNEQGISAEHDAEPSYRGAGDDISSD